jgi:hypothetical protein
MGERFSLLHNVQTSSGTDPASYTMSTRGCFQGVERPIREADHSPPPIVEVKNGVELYFHFLICLHGVVLN